MAPARLLLGGTALIPVLLGTLVAQVATVPSAVPAPLTSAIVLVSGRDDHGLLADPLVTLYDAPNSTTPLARVRDGSYARVLETRGTWQHIVTIAAPQSGWLDDYYLRGRAIRLDGGGQVTFAAARLTGDQVEIAVRPIEAPTTAPFWVPAARLREVGAK